MKASLPLNEKSLRALARLESLSREELAKYKNTSGMAHDQGFVMLSNVPNWLKHVRENHANPYSVSTVESCLDNLRTVVKRFKFDLKERE